MKNVSFRNDVLPLKNELFRLALRITLDRADAEDVVQETMIKVWSKRDSWDDIDNVEAFSMTICRNLALDHAKRRENDNSASTPTMCESRWHRRTPSNRPSTKTACR